MSQLLHQPQRLKRAAQFMKVLSHPNRMLVVDLLLDRGGLTVGTIAETLGLSQSNTSQQLKALEMAGVLRSDRQGKSILYSMDHPGIAQLMRCINACIDCDR